MPYLKHRIIAKQWIPNPDDLPEVDHINRIKTDNRIENLRWCSKSTNKRNKTSCHNIIYTYVKELPDDALVVDTYGDYEFEDYHFSESEDKFYYFNGTEYRILYFNEDSKCGAKYIQALDKDGKKVKICLNKFKRLYNII